MLLPTLSSGLRPAWRSARIFPRLSLSVQVQQRLGTSRANSSFTDAKTVPLTPRTPDQTRPVSEEPRLAIAFTCTADGCNHRSAHSFTKRAYERGIVIVQCPSCKNRHLIADNLDWFKDDTNDGQLRNIEDILRARGERVRRGVLEAGGVVEVSDS